MSGEYHSSCFSGFKRYGRQLGFYETCKGFSKPARIFSCADESGGKYAISVMYYILYGTKFDDVIASKYIACAGGYCYALECIKISGRVI